MSRQRRTRAQQRDDTRGAMIEAGIALFSQHGFEGTALAAVAEACGATVPLIVYHFGSKDALWRACVDAVYERVGERIATFADRIAAAEGLDFYRLSITAHVTALAEHPEFMRILFLEGTQQSERLAWIVERHQSRLSALYTLIIARAQSDGLLPQIDPVYAKFVLSGALSLPIVLAAEYRMTTGENPLSPDFIARHVEGFLTLILRPRAPSPPEAKKRPARRGVEKNGRRRNKIAS